MKGEMTEIIEFFQDLSSIDMEDVPMTSHVIPLNNILREDQVVESFTREEILQNAPTTDGEYIVVPRVVE